MKNGMKCSQINKRLDEIIEGALTPIQQQAVSQHLQNCDGCRNRVETARTLLRNLKELPVMPPRAGFENRVLAFLHPVKPAPQPRIWFAAGFASALLAALVPLVLWQVLLTEPKPAMAPIEVALVQVVPQQVQQVSLVFSSPNNIDTATLSLELPGNIELQGFPGQRHIEWQTSLKRGTNRLTLPLIAQVPTEGLVTASLSRGGETKSFQLRVKARYPSSTSSGRAS